jgi:hypothetical protein
MAFRLCLIFTFILAVLKLVNLIFISWLTVFIPIIMYYGIILFTCSALIWGFFNVLKSKSKYGN